MTIRDEAIEDILAELRDRGIKSEFHDDVVRFAVDQYEAAMLKRGFKLMPIKPSQKMVAAGMWVMDEDSQHPADLWDVMAAHAHGPADVGNVAKTLRCDCGTTSDLIECEPGMAAIDGAEGWSISGGREICPGCVKTG